MAYVRQINKEQVIIWQDGEFSQPVVLTPDPLDNDLFFLLEQRDNYINLSEDGAQALIKQLQTMLKNKEYICKKK